MAKAYWIAFYREVSDPAKLGCLCEAGGARHRSGRRDDF